MPFLPPNQQRQSTEGTKLKTENKVQLLHNIELKLKLISTLSNNYILEMSLKDQK